MTGKVGESPGKGIYKCDYCRWEVRMRDFADRLPPCGRCSKGKETQYIKQAKYVEAP